MKTLLLLLITCSLLSITALAAPNKDPKFWSKCHKDSDCALAKDKACDGLCYNKKFEKEAFDWEKKIVWECMNPSKKEKQTICEDNRCACIEKN